MNPTQREVFSMMETALREAHNALVRSSAALYVPYTMGMIEEALAAAEALRMTEAVSTLRQTGWTE